MIAADGLTIARGGRTILDGVTLDLAAGSFVAVVGANGAGKSTLMRALAGLLMPDAGVVRLDGRPIHALDRRQLARRRAYVPQAARAEWPVSVERLVALGLTPRLPAFGPVPPAFRQRIDEALARCDLSSQRDQPVTTLSGGELARAMLARALVGNPEVLIVDEPLAGLDPRHAIACAALLRSVADAGTLVVAALHDLTLAARHATHLAALKHGRLIAFGSVATVLDAALVRDLFGIDAMIVDEGSGLRVDFQGAPAPDVRTRGMANFADND